MPSAAEQSQTPNTNSTQGNSVPATDLRGTPDSPFIVEVRPPANSNPITITQTNEQGGKAAEDWWLIVPTWLLAIFTGLLFFYTARLWSATQALVAEGKRPHLRVANVHAVNFKIGNPIIIEAEIINNGSDDAIFHASAFVDYLIVAPDRFEFKPVPIVGSPYKTDIPEDTKLIPSQVYTYTFAPPGAVWTTEHLRQGVNGQGYFWGGKILYRDRRKRQRRLGTFRKFDPDTRRFRTVSDPEYEYDD